MDTQHRAVSPLFSGILLVVGTAIGGGMLGIPLVTAGAGFLPAALVTLAVALFMLGTGFLFMEAALWLPDQANVFSITDRFLGPYGRGACCAMFLFLYSCLLVAYVAAGSALMGGFIAAVFHIVLSPWMEIVLFGALFGLIIHLGHHIIDRANRVLSVGMLLAFVFFIGSSAGHVSALNLSRSNYPAMIFAIPVLFSSFGFHNVIPSLCTYLKRDKKALAGSLFGGIGIVTAVYLIWQLLFIGIIPSSLNETLLEEGKIATEGLSYVTGNSFLIAVGSFFAFFAISTSLLGVGFSMIDFYTDLFAKTSAPPSRFALTLLTLAPPVGFCLYNPQVFDQALGVAGGIGEAVMNGLLPVVLVWIGRYRDKLTAHYPFFSRPLLIALFAISCFVVLLELYILFVPDAL